jgi:hypothetical protein
MAKRLTKALRAKRRWVGLSISGLDSRAEVEEHLKRIAPTDEWRLMDFVKEQAILRILLKHDRDWRQVLSDPEAPIHSVTMSGKIRLVRERLGIPKPKQPRL